MTSSRHNLRHVLAAPGFRRLMAVRVAGQVSDGIFQAALFSAVFFNPERATSAGQAAGSFATFLLPYSVVGPFAGVFLDRWRRQRVLVNANLLRAALLAVFAVLLGLQDPTSPAVLTLALTVVSANRFILSGLSAALPHVVEPAYLVTANSFSTTIGAGAAAVGGSMALGLRELLGENDSGAAQIALIAALAYVGAGLLARRLGVDELGPTHPPLHERVITALGGVARGVAQGAVHVRERGQAARGLAAIGAHRFFYGLSFVATLLLYTKQGALHRGFAGLGQVVVASVVGGLVAALVTPGVTRRLGTQRWIAIVFAVAAVVEVAFGTPYRHWTLLVAAFFLGFAAQASKICVDTLVQEATEDDYRGRVFSFYDTLFNLSFVSAALVSALLVPANGKSYAVIGIVAVGYALTSAVYALATRRRMAEEPPEPIVV
ncbi:MAG: major facilitator superfamily 1 [Frankiales bacterium]|jgi:MFS family permease|nr:major facilitator superfamily 1 [Frankiales bacterium]